MQYDVETPEEYLNVLDNDWKKKKKKLLELRKIILSHMQDAEESIQYKMLAFSQEGKPIFHLNAQSGHVSLYVGNITKIDPEQRYLQGLNMGKGCIRFKKSDAVADTPIDKFILKALKLWHENRDIDC